MLSCYRILKINYIRQAMTSEKNENKIYISDIQLKSLFILNYIAIIIPLFFILIISKIMSYSSTIEVSHNNSEVIFFKNQFIVFILEMASVLLLSAICSIYFVCIYKAVAKIFRIFLIIK